MNDFISKENDFVRVGLGLHQLIGGSIGLYLIFIEPNLFFLIRLIVIGLFCFSIFAGYKIISSKSNIFYSTLNYMLQIFVFQFYDLVSFKYLLPFSFSLLLDIDTLDVLFNFYLQPALSLNFDYSGNSTIGLNLVGFFIFLFLISENGVRKGIFDYNL